MIKNYFHPISFLLFLLSFILVEGQVINTPGGVSCNVAGPICADNTGSFIFQNNNDPTTNIDFPIACLVDAPRPAWFFLRIDQTGDLAFQISQVSTFGNGLDVDFVVWGPFANDSGNCGNINTNCPTCPNNTADPNFYLNDLDNSNIVDCSYSGLSIENMTINNAQAGEFYLLLVSNFDGGNGTIEITQTNFGTPGGGSTDCSIINVDGILGPDQNICEATSIALDANPTNDPDFVNFTWQFDDGTGFVPIPSTDGLSIISVSNPGQYQVTITDAAGDSDNDTVEVVVTQFPTADAVPDQTICDTNNDGFFNFDFTTLNATVLGAQPSADFTVSYHNSLTDAENGISPITGVYTNTTAYTAETIFVRIENNSNPDCATTTSFDINVFNTPIANAVNNQLICDDNNDGFWDFDLDALRTIVLGTQSATDYTITFHPSLPDADANTGQLPNMYTNQVAYDAETIFVRIENILNTDCYVTTNFSIDVFNQPIANTIPDQLICDDNNDGFWSFDFVALESFVLGSQPAADFQITFHTTQNDADFNLLPIAAPYTNLVAFQQETIFVRIENADNSNCFDTTNFIIDVFDQPTATPFTYELCDDDLDTDDTNGFVQFDLSSINTQVLGGQNPAQFTVSYHFDQADADNGASPLLNAYTNAVANAQQIIARVENNDNPDCYETAVIDLVVNPLPVITNTVDLLQCDNDTDGITNFNLTEAEVLISTNASLENFTYYLNFADADSAQNEILNPIAYTNTDPSSNPDLLFVRVQNANGCHRIAELNLFVSATDIPAGIEILYEACDTDAIDGSITNGITTFDFSDAETQIRALAGLPTGQNLTFTFYETEADALAETNSILDISNHRNDASPFEQEIYVRVDSDIDNACVGLGLHVRLRTINPTPNLNPPNLFVCDDVTPSDLIETFDLTQNETFIFNSDPNVAATYHFSFADANSGTGAIANPSTYTNTNSSETIFVRVTNINTGCYAIVDFDIVVNPLPAVNVVVSDFFECENNTDFIFDFDLETKTDEILNGQDPTQFTVTYHDSQADADNLVDALTSPYTNTSNPQQIFVAITNNTTGCSISTLSFNLEVNEGGQVNSDGVPILYEICDNVLDNDGFAQFDLTTQTAELLDGQDPTAFTLTYHDSFDDAFNNLQPLPTLYENLTNPQVLYVRVSNNLRPDVCFDVGELTLQVNLLPIFDLDDEYILCLSSNDSAVVSVPPILDTALPATDYTFEWQLNGAVLPAETAPSLIPTQGGTYSVTVTDITTSLVTSCTNFDETIVTESGIPDTFDVNVTSQAFTGSNMVIAVATGNSTYEYSLDNGPWVAIGEFEDVTGGEHVVSARDINGCGIVSQNVLVIDYPKFFTPNGDGNNDTWTIDGIFSQPSAVIYIFDRYGKLLKQLSPTSAGWDGTFRGNLMPSSDYWFAVAYTEPTTGEVKNFRAHFTLKR
jgi:gliding motility-associated-like protein